jgi:DNA-binding response OmpR family regulator
MQTMEISPTSTCVIVADDDPIIRSILRAKLEALDQNVLLASDGQEAVALASKVQASLVILDIAMPNVDGIVACVRIRCLAGYATTPIVMLTADDSEQASAKASRAGATLLMVKPFDRTLLSRLATFLRIDEHKLQSIQGQATGGAKGGVVGRISEMHPCFSVRYPD